MSVQTAAERQQRPRSGGGGERRQQESQFQQQTTWTGGTSVGGWNHWCFNHQKHIAYCWSENISLVVDTKIDWVAKWMFNNWLKLAWRHFEFVILKTVVCKKKQPKKPFLFCWCKLLISRLNCWYFMTKLQHIHLKKLSSDEVFSSKLVFSLNAAVCWDSLLCDGVCWVFCVVTSSLREQHSNNL